MPRSLVLLILLLTGCATAPVALQRPLQADAPFAFNGRVAVKQGEQRDSAGMRWVHSAEADEILLLAPLGQTVARIRRDDGEATLEASGRHYAAQDMESLMQQVLGWQLPLAGMRYWVTALPAPDMESLMQQVLGWQLPLAGMRYWVTALPSPEGESHIERDTNGQVSLLRQQGWEISYTRYAAESGDALPLRLKLQREGMEVLLLIDEWEAQ